MRDDGPGVFRTWREAVRYISWWLVAALVIVIFVLLGIKIL
jgi:hypothetical protein